MRQDKNSLAAYRFPYWTLPDGLTDEGYKYFLEARQLITELDEAGKGKLNYDSPELQGQRLYLFTPQWEDDNPQLPFLKSQARERWFIAPNQVGKTLVVVHDILSACIGKHPYRQHITGPPPLDVWVVSDTDETSIEIVQNEIYRHMPEFAEFLEPNNDYTRGNGWKNDIITFKKPYGSVISFKNVKQGVGKFGGVKRDIVWIDTENPNFREVYYECQMRTVSKGGTMIVSYVPCHGYDWTYYDIDAMKYKKPGLEVFGAPSTYCNKYLSRKTLEQVEEGLSEAERQGRIFGKYSVPSGAVYDIFNSSIHGIEPERQKLPHPYDGRWYMDIDFGWEHPFAWLLRWVDGDGRHCCIDEIKQSHLDTEKRARLIIQKLERNGLVEWKNGIGITPIRAGICDPAEPLEIRELSKELKKQLGKAIKMVAAPRLRVEDGARIVYRLLKPVEWKDGLKLPRWFYWKGKGRCVELEREMSTLHYKEGTDDIESVNDDLCAANRYGIVACEAGRRIGFHSGYREEREED